MNSYQPATPRTAFGVIAFVLTVVTFGLSVVAPAVLVAQSEAGATTGQMVTAGPVMKVQS